MLALSVSPSWSHRPLPRILGRLSGTYPLGLHSCLVLLVHFRHEDSCTCMHVPRRRTHHTTACTHNEPEAHTRANKTNKTHTALAALQKPTEFDVASPVHVSSSMHHTSFSPGTNMWELAYTTSSKRKLHRDPQYSLNHNMRTSNYNYLKTPYTHKPWSTFLATTRYTSKKTELHSPNQVLNPSSCTESLHLKRFFHGPQIFSICRPKSRLC